jgi:hypothetical protein
VLKKTPLGAKAPGSEPDLSGFLFTGAGIYPRGDIRRAPFSTPCLNEWSILTCWISRGMPVEIPFEDARFAWQLPENLTGEDVFEERA